MPRNVRTWYRIENLAGDTARVYLMDEIGMWGVTAGEFVREISSIVASTLELHVSSPGGDVADGLAIFQALQDHPARVVAQVDGLAASAASFIIQAADEVVMAPKASVMIHEANGLTVGSAADHREMAALLDKFSANIASIYADRAGGTVEDWRAAMQAETWYSADEAVAAGLADRIVGQDAEEEAPQRQQPALAARFDLSKFRYPGRDAAPAPKLPTAATEAPGAQTRQALIDAGWLPDAVKAAVMSGDDTTPPSEPAEPPADTEPATAPAAPPVAPDAIPEPVEPDTTDDAGAESSVTDEDTWGALVAQLTTTIAPLDVIGDALASLREATQ